MKIFLIYLSVFMFCFFIGYGNWSIQFTGCGIVNFWGVILLLKLYPEKKLVAALLPLPFGVFYCITLFYASEYDPQGVYTPHPIWITVFVAGYLALAVSFVKRDWIKYAVGILFSTILFYPGQMFFTTWATDYQNMHDLSQVAYKAMSLDAVMNENYISIADSTAVKMQPGKKRILIDYWSLDCVPCREQLGEMGALMQHNPYSNKYEVYSVVVPLSADDKDLKNLRKIMPNNNSHFLLADDKSLLNRININGVPQYIVIDTSGKIIATGITILRKTYPKNIYNLMKSL